MTNLSVSQKLHEDLSKVIAETESGARLPTEPVLAKQLGVSRATLREAMRTFESQGIIRRRQGSGTFVSRPSKVIDSGLEILQSIEKLANQIGLKVEMGELIIERRKAKDEECSRLELSPCDEVMSVSRVIHADGRPVAFLIDILPVDILEPADLVESFTGSILDLLLTRGQPKLYISRTDINAVQAPSNVARALMIQRGDVLLCFEADLYSNEEKAVDHSFSYFLPGYFHFHVVRRVAD